MKRGVYFPEKFGGRFARNDAIPSRPSAVRPIAEM
jgi:hypothetical protein